MEKDDMMIYVYIRCIYIYIHIFFDFLILRITLLKYKASFFFGKAANIIAIRKHKFLKIALFIGRLFAMIATCT